MKCAICKGILNPIKDKLLITIEGQDILISNIEMLECQNCGERYLTPDTDEKVENLISKYKQGENYSAVNTDLGSVLIQQEIQKRS